MNYKLSKLIILILITSCFLSCGKSNVSAVETEYTVNGLYNPLKIIVVDSCEYLYGDWGNATVLTHKGNCKFCAERMKK